jgi:hypothetical protein
MQIQELEITRKLQNAWGGGELAQVLASHGWHRLGSGVEAGVAEHPQKAYVLKIFPQDSAYVHFVRMVQSHPHNPHFPRFSRYVRLIPGTKYAYVRMEKLSRMLDYDLAQYPSLLCLLDNLWFHHAPDLNPPHWIRSNITWDPDQTDVPDCNQVSITPTEQEAIQLLSDQIKKLHWRNVDLHAANFMQRDSTWVITDPFI